MVKILTLSILLTIIYSWDEVIRLLRIFINGLFRKNIFGYYQNRTDQIVGPIVMVAALPITLVGLLAYHPESVRALLLAGLTLLIISIIAAGSGVFVRRMRAYHMAEVKEKPASLAYAMLGILSPLASPMLVYDILPRAELARIAFWLSLPPLCGLAIAYGNRAASAPTELLPNLDALTLLLVVGLITMLAIRLLAHAFHSYKINSLFSFVRIILGIILAAVVVMGII